MLAFFGAQFIEGFRYSHLGEMLALVGGDLLAALALPPALLVVLMIIILSLMQRYARTAGLGTLVTTMLPYTLAFLAVWLVLLTVWVLAGWSLGPGGALG